jgi:hypothetical protein
MRRCGLQAALLQERMRYAFDHGCDLLLIVGWSGQQLAAQCRAQRIQFFPITPNPHLFLPPNQRHTRSFQPPPISPGLTSSRKREVRSHGF